MAAVKKTFNNPVVVGILVLLAVAFVFRDFIHFSASPAKTKHASSTSRVASQLPLKAEPTASLPQTKNNQSSIAKLKQTDWNRMARMPLSKIDPFSPEAMLFTRQTGANSKNITTTNRAAAPEMKLRAIVSAKNIHYATINDQVLQMGDMINGWKLVAISTNQVQLQGSIGLLTLNIHGGMHMGGERLPLTEKKSLRDQQLFDSLMKKGIVSEVSGTRMK